MSQRNSYFKMDLRPEGAFVRIFPAREDGKILRISELTTYLTNRGYASYDIKELNRLVFLQQESELRVGDNDGIAVNEMMNIEISSDSMKVVCRFYPSSTGGSMMTEQEIIKDLQFRGIRVDINQEKIQEFLNDRTYCTDYVLAEGKRPEFGKDAEIEYFFQTDVTLRPKTNEDGSVDYKNLDTISHVEEGERLARLIPADPGKSGVNVYGQEIKPPTVKTAMLSFGNNITLSEDGTEIYSNVTGHVNLIGGKVFVSDVYSVPADVDNSIGNIDYQGNVEVRGNVKGGFYIRAHGDIVVNGVVEDSVLEADGQIIVKRGIHGKTKGVLRAKGNIICKFIENATVESGGYIETDSILHSHVSATTEIHVSGKNGFITGGLIRAGSLIEAHKIGSDLGAPTRVEVGVDPSKRERYSAIQKSLAQIQKDLTQLQPVLLAYSKKMSSGEKLEKDKIVYIQQLATTVSAKQNQQKELQQEYVSLHEEITQSSDARIKIKKTIYPGVAVGISDVCMTIKNERNFCQISKKDGDICISAL